MKKNAASARKDEHLWSSEALLAKALRYAQEMQTLSRNDWRFGLMSTFVIEFLGRSALAATSPVLLADEKAWENIFFALGNQPKTKRFIPKSIDVSRVFDRLGDIYPEEITQEIMGYARTHLNCRNEELHAGSNPFEEISAKFLAPFYLICQRLLSCMSLELEYLFGPEDAVLARKLIATLRDESGKAVKKAIEEHRAAWNAKGISERRKLSRLAMAWATRQDGHRVKCPACESEALVCGTPAAAPVKRLKEDLIEEVQDHLPNKFECVACALKIAGLSHLMACGLGATYKSTSSYDIAEYYAPVDPYSGFEDDNNEY